MTHADLLMPNQFSPGRPGGRLGPLLMVLLAGVFTVSFWPVLNKLVMHWDSGDNSYCYLIPPIFLYLCWDRRGSFRFGDFSWSAWGLVPTLLSLALMAAGELGSVETLQYVGLWGAVFGIFTLLYGLRVRQLLFPFLVLLFMVPLPPYINRVFTFNLKMAASTVSVAMLRLSGISVLQEGNVIDLGLEKLQVVDACSGLRYVVPMVLLALLINYFFVNGRWRQLLMLAIVIPLAVAVNGLRIYITGLLTVNGHEELARSFFHDFAGFVIFLVAGVILFGAARLLNRIGPAAAPGTRVDRGSGRVRSGTAVGLLVTYLVLFAGSGWALQRLPHSQIIPERRTFADFPMEIDSWQGERNFLSQEILDALWADDYLNATFTSSDHPGQRIYLLIPYYGYQGTRHTAHAPQSCLLGGGWAMVASGERTIPVGGGETIRVGTMTLEKDNYTMLGSYFFLTRGRVITSPWMNKLYLMWDAFSRRRTDGALVRVEMVLAEGQSQEKAYRDLDRFVAELWSILPPYVPG